jgi:hypothetical protein
MLVMADEADCEFVSSRGILKSCDCKSSAPESGIEYLTNYEPSANKKTIYVCSTALHDFVNRYLANIKTKFVLVSGDADNPVPKSDLESFETLIQNEYLVAWYSQNLVISPAVCPKMRHLPIGLDYHFLSSTSSLWGTKSPPLEQEKMLKTIIGTTVPFWERLPLIYSTFHFEIARGDRKEALSKIPSELIYYEPKIVLRMDTFKTQTKYAFVASPHGGGLDCHRTWEALCLGCIPIIRSSPINELFEGLPVLIVNDWMDITRELLHNTIVEYKAREFNMEKLKLKYWIDKINAEICQ